MSDLTPILQEMSDRVDATEMLAPHEIRRAGERRRKRALVATTTCVVLGSIAVVLGVGVAARDTASDEPANPPGPTRRSSPGLVLDDRIGMVGPPPAGTPPSGPATGQLVAGANLYDSGTWVYADGRIINVDRDLQTREQFRGYVVRQLTPSGVEAMRSYLLDGTSGLTPVDKTGGELIVRDGRRLMFARDFRDCGAGHGSAGFANAVGCPAFTDPEEWLPASAWEDPTFRAFVPYTYEICLSAHDFAVLPTTVAAVFEASPARDGLDAGDCRAVATDDARSLLDALEEAGAVTHGEPNLEVDLRSLGGNDFTISPILPHGGQIYCNCG